MMKTTQTTHQHNTLYTFLLTLALMLTTACSPPASDTEVDKVVEKLITAFHEGNVDKIMSFYGEEFYKNRDPDQWRMELNDLFSKYGKVQSVSMRNKQADTRFSGKFYIYQFDTLHNYNKRLKHTLTLIRPVNERDKIVVVGHMIKTH
jgi:hypothetical protein